ncbi:MAG: nuclear transport factor 2 family protein [Candidatus Eisenbacteria bacterium]
MTPLEVAGSFVAAINSGEVDRLVGLMTPEHMFIDADGSEHVGREGMRSGWREHFKLVPDLRIEVFQRFEAADTVVLLGRASGTIVENGELTPDNHWIVPAAWRVVVDSDLVAIWQLYANQHRMHEILERIRTE